MSELRLCKEDFLQYRTLEVQEKYYKKQLAELRDKYLIVDTVQDYRNGGLSAAQSIWRHWTGT